MKIFLFLLCGVCFISFPVFCQDDPLKVEILIPKDIMTDSFKQDHGIFLVTTKIKNISAIEQKIHYWTCGFMDSWVSDHADIIIQGNPCNSNLVAEKILKPNEEFIRGGLPVAVSPNARVGKISFRLGFDPAIPIGPSFEQMHVVNERVIWSNEVSLNVTAKMLKFIAPIKRTSNIDASKPMGCVHGFGGWITPQKPPIQERACDEQNLKEFQMFLGRCKNVGLDQYDMDKDTCATCLDYFMWKKMLKKLYERHERSTDGGGRSLDLKACDTNIRK